VLAQPEPKNACARPEVGIRLVWNRITGGEIFGAGQPGVMCIDQETIGNQSIARPAGKK